MTILRQDDIYIGDQTERSNGGTMWVAYALYLRPGTRWWHPRYRVVFWGGYLGDTRSAALASLTKQRLKVHEDGDEAVGPNAEFHPA